MLQKRDEEEGANERRERDTITRVEGKDTKSKSKSKRGKRKRRKYQQQEEKEKVSFWLYQMMKLLSQEHDLNKRKKVTRKREN